MNILNYPRLAKALVAIFILGFIVAFAAILAQGDTGALRGVVLAGGIPSILAGLALLIMGPLYDLLFGEDD